MFFTDTLPNLESEILELKHQVHKFKDYDAKINRRLVAKPCEFVQSKLNEYRGLVDTYLITHKESLNEIMTRVVKTEIGVEELATSVQIYKSLKKEVETVKEGYSRVVSKVRDMGEGVERMKG